MKEEQKSKNQDLKQSSGQENVLFGNTVSQNACNEQTVSKDLNVKNLRLFSFVTVLSFTCFCLLKWSKLSDKSVSKWFLNFIIVKYPMIPSELLGFTRMQFHPNQFQPQQNLIKLKTSAFYKHLPRENVRLPEF